VHDLVIRGATMVDGLGGDPIRADVAVRDGRIAGIGEVGFLPADHPAWWGRSERALRPPLALLRWLVRHASEPASAKAWGADTTRRRRKLLVRRDPKTVQQALELLDGKIPRRAWYVLEGESRPDACLQTDRMLLVVEGKRTEPKATTTTTWMKRRSQLVRHMDSAWEGRGNRRVFGLLVVEAQHVDRVPPDWTRETDAEFSKANLVSSLPHRTPQERDDIAAGFLGTTTWQMVCRKLSLPWPPGVDTL